MSSFTVRELEQESCEKCGKRYRVQYQNLPIRDRDYFSCKCGHTLRSWNETGMYMYQEVEG